MKKENLEMLLKFMYKYKIKLFRNKLNRKLDIKNDNKFSLISNREEI